VRTLQKVHTLFWHRLSSLTIQLTFSDLALFKTSVIDYQIRNNSAGSPMRIFTTSVLISVLAVSACGTIRDSAVNPANWFGKSSTSRTAVEQKASTNLLLPGGKQRTGLFAKIRARDAIYQGQPIDQVTNLVIERVPGGAVIRATGLTAVQGVYSVQLTPVTDDNTAVDGVLTYRFEGIRPASPQGTGTNHTRTVVAARALTHQQLQGVRTIRVQAARNAQTSRR
jgi:hypothetical protein